MPDACPIWSLRDLYEGVDSPAVQTDIAACRKAALALAADWQSKIATISGAELADVITAYEAVMTSARQSAKPRTIAICSKHK